MDVGARLQSFQKHLSQMQKPTRGQPLLPGEPATCPHSRCRNRQGSSRWGCPVYQGCAGCLPRLRQGAPVTVTWGRSPPPEAGALTHGSQETLRGAGGRLCDAQDATPERGPPPAQRHSWPLLLAGSACGPGPAGSDQAQGWKCPRRRWLPVWTWGAGGQEEVASLAPPANIPRLFRGRRSPGPRAGSRAREAQRACIWGPGGTAPSPPPRPCIQSDGSSWCLCPQQEQSLEMPGPRLPAQEVRQV